MFLQILSGSSGKSAKTQASGPIAITRGLSLLFMRAAHLPRSLARRIAAFDEGRMIDRRLRTRRWCDSTERALTDDLRGL